MGLRRIKSLPRSSSCSQSSTTSSEQKHCQRNNYSCHKHRNQHTHNNIQYHHRQHHQHIMHRYLILVIAFINLFQLIVGSPVFNNPSISHFQSGRNIRHLPCIVRRTGLEGVCMFAIDCIKSNGTHLGTCIDRFYFGSCCQIEDESLISSQDISDNSIDQNTISHFKHESTTTVPTSSLFKVTTESYSSSTLNSNRNSTSGLRIPEKNTDIPISSPLLNITILSTKSPQSNSTRTTSRPLINKGVPSFPTTQKLTTSKQPVLTTSVPMKTRPNVVTTTTPPKFSTFQSVQNEETTVTTEQQPSRFPSTTISKPQETTTVTRRPTTTTHIESNSSKTTTKRPTKRPTTQRVTKPTRRTPATSRPTVVETIPTTTIVATRKPQRNTTTTTTKRPQTINTSKRPTTTRKPTATTTKRQTSRPKPTRRPVTPFITTSTTGPIGTKRNTTKVETTTRSPAAQTQTPTLSTISFVQSTKAPRPKPKPTSHIVKVTTNAVKTEVKEVNKTTIGTSTAPTTTLPPRTSTSSTTSTTTTTEKPITKATTLKPITTAARPSSTSTVSSETTTSQIPTTLPPRTTVAPQPLTTEKPTTTQRPAEITTLKPGLVTWTNLDELKNNFTSNSTTDDEWIPVSTIKPEDATTKIETTTMGAPTSSSSTTIRTSPPPTTMSTTTKIPTTTKPITTLAPSSTQEIPKLPINTTTMPSTVQTGLTVESSTTPGLPPNVTFRPSIATTISSTASAATTTEHTTTWPSSQTSTPGPDGFIFSTTTGLPSLQNVTFSTMNSNVTTPRPPFSTSPFPSLEGIDYKQLCGKRMFPEPRIVGGSNAAFGRWPWQISLRQWRTSTYLHKCGAALLNENWAITAAHCVDNVPPSDLLLRLGEYDLAEEEEPYGYQERRVQIVAAHTQFDPRTFEYDLALLRFYEPVTFQPNIIPVCVPDSDENFIGQTGYVTGWGRLYEDGPLPSVLQEVSVPIINNTICETMYRSAGYIEHIPHIFICAGWQKGGYDSCEGDSGGPLVLQRDDKRFLLAGIISWGIGCAEPNQPGVYTRISEFRDWINQILQF